jgi:signal transduction histidine kinase
MMDANIVLERIIHLSCRMAETRDLQPLLIYAVDEALELFNAEHGYLAMKNPDGSLDFRVKRQTGKRDITEPEVSHQILNRVLTEGKPVTTANALEDPAFDTSSSVKALNLRSVMCVPLIAHNDVIGVLQLDNRMEAGVFTESDLQFLQLFANQSAVSIENAILNEELEARIEARTAELDAYARTVAHDLKNPISYVLGYADLLESNWGELSEEDTRESLNYIMDSSQKACNIIDELLLLATVRKQIQIPFTTMDMAQIVAGAQVRLGSLVQEYRADIAVPETWPEAVGYEPWVEEVWVNYISNAIKYGGTPPQIKLGAERQPDNQIRFWVQDNGEGISPEKLKLLFVEFTRLETARAQGHGLGLSIVQRIIKRLGGQVGAESVVGEGSTFWFTLPAADY